MTEVVKKSKGRPRKYKGDAQERMAESRRLWWHRNKEKLNSQRREERATIKKKLERLKEYQANDRYSEGRMAWVDEYGYIEVPNDHVSVPYDRGNYLGEYSDPFPGYC